MSLVIYRSSNGQGAVSTSGSYTAPLTFEIAQTGGVLEQRLYLRSDNPSTESIADGMLFARDSTLPDESSWVGFAEDINGAAGIYDTQFTFNIGLGEELPFWIKLDVPQGQEQGTKVDISLVTRHVRVAL